MIMDISQVYNSLQTCMLQNSLLTSLYFDSEGITDT